MPSVPADLLRSISIFSALDGEDSAALAALARETSYRKGDAVFVESDPAGDLYLVLSGVVEIFRQAPGEARPIALARLERGDVLGEISLFDGGRRSASASAAVTPETRLAVWDAGAFRRYLQDRPRAGLSILSALLGQMGRRLRQTSEVVHTLVRAL